MTHYHHEGADAAYMILGIIAFLLVLGLVSYYLFGSKKVQTQPDRSPSSGVYWLFPDVSYSA